MAVSITYQNLKDLRDNAQLTVGEKYEVNDYPTFHPIMEAVAAGELSQAGTTSNGWTLLYSLDSDNPNPPAGFKGLVIYLSNGSIEAWFDWVNDATIGNSVNVSIAPTFDSDGYRTPYQGAIVQCSNVVIYGAGSLDIIGCQNVIVGSGNSGELRGCNYITVGDNNAGISVQFATGCRIGSNNSGITVTANNTEIGDSNQGVAISAPNGSVGSGNRDVTVSAQDFEIGNGCLKVDVSAKYAKVSDTMYTDIKAPYNTVRNSSGVELVDSVGNTVDGSRLVYLRDVNNNDIYASEYIQDTEAYTLPSGGTVQYNTPEPKPFMRVRPNNTQKPYRVATSMIANISNQADNFGVVVDKNSEERKSSSVAQRYYIADGVWTLEDTQSQTAYVTMVMPKSESAKVEVTGWGEYAIGTTVTLDFRYTTGGCWAEFVDENGTHHSAPYSFIISADTQVGVSVYTVPNDEIWYTTTDSNVVTPSSSAFNPATVSSNTYSNGKGVIKLNQPLTSVAGGSFQNRTTLASITLPPTVTSIGSKAFFNTGLTSFVVPASVTSVGGTAFGKTSMTSLRVDPANTVYDSREDCNAIIHSSSNELKVGCMVSTVPGTVTKIGSTAFDDQQTMTAIAIPASVTSIGYAAFNSCQLLTSITLLGNSYPQASSAFTGTFSSTGTVHGQAEVDYTTFMSWLPAGWTLVQ